VCDLKCNLIIPLWVDTQTPVFSWSLEPSENSEFINAYRILVASSSGLLERDTGDVWDNGKVLPEQFARVPYKGPKLISGKQ